MKELFYVNEMSNQEKIAVIRERAIGGRNINVKFQSFPKLRKEWNGRVKKVSVGTISMNKNYRNLSVNKDRAEEDFKPLPASMHFVIDNILLEKVNEDNSVSYLVRCYPGTLKNVKMSSEYTLDNQPITKQELIDRGIIKDKPHTDIPCFNIKLENLIALGNEEEE